jgi:NAD(P)-dependent dehydrogenase (short-subunit alcohol dehydrogenase family)
MSAQFDGLHVVVTGGTGALGRAVVRAILAEGAHCHLPSRHDKLVAGDEFAGIDSVRFEPRIVLSDEASVSDFYANLPKLWASIHVAGGFAMAPLIDTSLAQFEAQMQSNVYTAFLSLREAARHMIAHESGGRIVNVVARPALEPVGGMVAYSTAKSAVASMTQCTAKELASQGILVNAVAPSIMDTPDNRLAMPDADFSCWPSTSEIARVIVALASPQNKVTSGAIVPVYGRG